jgi:hypothetical protein
MQTTMRVSADTGDNARKMAINMARAQGWVTIQAVFVQQVGPREYDVTMTVSR